MSARRGRSRLGLAMLLLAAAAVHTTWLALDRSPPWIDELRSLQTIDEACAQLASEGVAAVPPLFSLGTPHPPALPLTALPFEVIGGGDFRWTRLVNVAWLLFGMLGVFALGRRYGPPGAALTLAAVFGFAPFAFQLTSRLLLECSVAALLPWALLALLDSRGFRRPGACFVFGLAAGGMMLGKWTAAAFLLGPVALAGLEALRGRHGPWRARAVSLVALLAGAAIATPWYVTHLGDVVDFLRFNEGADTLPHLAQPVSRSDPFSYLFYACALDDLLGAVLAISVLFGTAVLILRRSARTRPALHVAASVGIAYAIFSLVSLKEPRHLSPAAGALAWLGTAWILRLVRARRARAILLTVALVGTTAAGLLSAFGATPCRRLVLAPGVDLGLLPPSTPPARRPWPHRALLDAIQEDFRPRHQRRPRPAEVLVITRVQGVDLGAFRHAARSRRNQVRFRSLGDGAFDLAGFRRADYYVLTSLPDVGSLPPRPWKPVVEAGRWFLGASPPGPPPVLQEFFAARLPVGVDLLVFRRRGDLDREALMTFVRAIETGRPQPPDLSGLRTEAAATAARPGHDGASLRRVFGRETVQIWRAPRRHVHPFGMRAAVSGPSGETLDLAIEGEPDAVAHLVGGGARTSLRTPFGWMLVAEPRELAQVNLDGEGRGRIALPRTALGETEGGVYYLQALVTATKPVGTTNWVAVCYRGPR